MKGKIQGKACQRRRLYRCEIVHFGINYRISYANKIHLLDANKNQKEQRRRLAVKISSNIWLNSMKHMAKFNEPHILYQRYA